MISPEYIEQNKTLHDINEEYGTSGRKFAQIVQEICQQHNTLDILDYGCGKATLDASLPGFMVRNYDPGIEEHSAMPEPADIVVCTDVMEHIEPPFVEDVLDHIKSVMIKGGLITIASRPAKKSLPDGRNAHLIQENYRWWLPKIWDRFNVMQFDNLSDKEYILILRAI